MTEMRMLLSGFNFPDSKASTNLALKQHKYADPEMLPFILLWYVLRQLEGQRRAHNRMPGRKGR